MNISNIGSQINFLKRKERSQWQEEPDKDKFLEAWGQIIKGNPRFHNQNIISQTMAYGVPSETRLEVWTRLLGLGTYRDHQLEPSKEIIDLIKCDLPRTFGGKHNSDELFEDRDTMQKVLIALSHPESLGTYCQGLNYLAVIFLQVAKNDNRRLQFSTLGVESLVLKLQMKTYFYDGMRQLRADIIVLSEFIDINLPYILPLFKDQCIELNYCAANWFLCLYSNIDLRYEDVFRLWDYIICEGFGGVIRIAIALLDIAIPPDEVYILEHDDIAKRVKCFPNITALEILNKACQYELPSKIELSKLRHDELQEIGRKDAAIELINKLRRSGGRTRRAFW